MFRSSDRRGLAAVRRAALAAGPWLLASCVTGDYDTIRTFQPPPDGTFDDLVVGVSDAGQAMRSLGAPVQVIEVGRGMALAWGWLETTAWNVAASVPVGDVSGRLSFTDTDQEVPGIVLFFDEDWRLTSKRRGFLAELVPEARPPRDVDDELLGPDPGGVERADTDTGS